MLLKKAGMVVLAAGAGMVALTPAAFAGDYQSDAPSDNGGHSWDGDHGKDHGHDHGHWGQHPSYNHASASSCSNGVGQVNASRSGGLLNVLGGSDVAAPINACHILDDNNILNNVGIDVL
jgi:hypothetical protein